MIAALRETPDEFELSGSWLNHIRSRHSFRFGPDDDVEISATCDCALLAVSSEQKRELAVAYRQWESDYWRPLQINREFASHFGPRPVWRQMLIALTGRLHRWLLTSRPYSTPAESVLRST
jgi:hypothetical protein